MLSYLEVEDGFIKISQLQQQPDWQQWTELPNAVRLRMLDAGVLEVQPSQPSDSAIILSCGVHGNETAPIEIVSKLISQIVTGTIKPTVNLLLVLGNPESMKIEQRFTAINLNRLFAGGYKTYEVDDQNRYELKRAERLEQLVGEFFEASDFSRKLHLDLHTAIKPSFHKTFAIRPYARSGMSEESKHLLMAMGIEAVLQHNKPSTTFSYFSVDQYAAEAYTLELGKVKKFGENDPEDFAAAINCLNQLVTNQPIAVGESRLLIEYKVVAEIIRHSDELKFNVPENVENFTAFPQGYLIAEDIDFNYRVAYREEAVVFPNTNVPIGQRVAVMVTKANDD